jgi:PAS domain S-box-containing protein
MEQKKLQVLLVDDDPNLRATMQDILKAKGFEPVAAKTAAAALAQIHIADIDVALIDLNLEDMPGLELLQKLKLISASMECILLTGHASQGSAIEAINAGAFSYFQKPCDIDQLVLSIRRAGEKCIAGQALRASEASLQAVLQSTADGILAVNAESKVLYANQRFAELWHIPPGILASQDDATLLQFILDQLVDPQSFLKKVQELYQSEEESFDTLDFKDGRVFERVSRPLIKAGVLGGRVWSFRDVTERKQVEEKLADERTLLRTLIDNLPDRVYVMDEKGRKVLSNTADWQASGGKKMEDVIGKTDLETYSPELAQNFWAVDKAVIDSGTPIINLEEPGLDSRGNMVSVLSSKIPLRDGQGRITGLVGIGRDITDRKQAEKALQESEEHFHSLFENMSEGVALHELVLDETGQPVNYRLVDCNPQYEQILGIQRSDVMGILATEVYAASSAPYLKEYSRVALSGISIIFETYFAPMHKYFEISVAPWGKNGFATIFTDISERKQTEAELQASRAEEQNFAERLAILSEVTTELSKAEDIDSLCRRTVELGRERLDFDRLSIWFLAQDHTTMLGTFGVDNEGSITDERGKQFPVEPDFSDMPVLQGQIPLLRRTNAQLTLLGQVVGQGMHVAAGLWDGKSIIGYITLDNLLRQRLFSDRDCEIIRLYASALGHLISVKRAEGELRTSEERYRMLAENMTDTLWLMDLDLKTTYISPSVTKLRGYTLQELNTIPLDQQMAPESFALFVKLFTSQLAPKNLAQTDSPISAVLELELYRKDGSTFWSANTFNLIRDPLGQPLAILVSGRDITESRHAWEALQNSEKRFRALIENSTEALVLIDPRGRLLYESPAYARMTGRDTRERLGQSIFEFVHPQDRPDIVRILNELVQSPGRIAQVTFRNQHKDGSWRWLEATSSNFLGDSAVQAVVINLHDITERKQAEQDLRQRVTQLEVLYETGLNISSLLEPKEIGRKVIEVLSEKMSWSPATIRLYYPESQRLELLVFNRPGLTAGQLQAETRRLNRAITKPGQGLSGWVVQHGQPLRSTDVNSDPRYIRTFKGIQSGLYVPMLVGGRTIGVISVESEQSAAFTEVDERLLTTLAAQAGVAIENARLLAETLRRVEELGALADCSAALRTALTRSEIVSVILDQLIIGMFPADNACLAVYDPLTGGNTIEAARGLWNKYIGQRMQSGEGLIGLLAETRRPYQSNDFSRTQVIAPGSELKQMEAAAGVPLLVQDQLIGSLWIGRTGNKKAPNLAPFSAGEMQLLGSIGDMAANALQRSSLHEQALKHADELLAVNNMGRILAETLDLYQVYTKLDESVWQLLGDISLVAIVMYDSEKKQLTCVRFSTAAGPGDAAILPPAPLEPAGQGTQSEAVHTRQPVIINDLRKRMAQLNFKMDVGLGDLQDTQSGLYVPMLAHGRVIGVIQAQSNSLNRFSQSDAGLLSLVANTAAADIENARLFTETQKRLHNLAALHEIDVAISASVDVHVTLDILLEQTVSELKVDAAAVLLLNPLARTLEYAASQGFHNHQIKGLHIPLGIGLAGQAALQRQIQSASDLPDDLSLHDTHQPAINIYEGEGFISHHAIPLSAKGQVQGVLEVFLRSHYQPDDEWFSFLETLARQAAIAIDNNNMFDNLQRSNTNIVLAYDATIQGWSQALELRDKETEGHARRVTERTVQLAQLVGVPAADLEHVRRGTLLHDIGKMGIPDAILLKPDKLTEAEWVIMRRHPVFAYEMLSSIAYLRPALDIPHYHHEKWDGTGYPDGLKAGQIPLYARIFAVVDVYDALTNDRPYRSAWSAVRAVEYIRAESGKHFDPAIVEVFLNLLAREK